MSHMNLNERIKIEGMLNQRCRKIQIAKELNRSLSTISREINKHRILKPHHPQKNDNYYNCKYFKNCKVCTGKCKIFQPISCKERDKNIGACNECPLLRTCKLDKFLYIAEKADIQYKFTLKDSRMGVNLNTSELFELAHTICLLIKKGQSIYTILNNHPEINLSEKTIYNYIDMGLFKDWDITNFSLKRKIRRRSRKKRYYSKEKKTTC